MSLPSQPEPRPDVTGPPAAATTGRTTAPTSDDPGASSLPRAVTLRSVLLGLVGVVFICGLTPYNDYAVGNTFLVGNFLPVGVVLYLLVLTLAVNLPLRRFAPSWAMTTGELSVILVMTLVSCAMPSSGLMRYLPTYHVGQFNEANQNPSLADTLASLDLPEWVRPRFQTPDASVVQKANEAVIQNYVGRVPAGDGFAERFAAVPWDAWIRFLGTWGVFVMFLLGAVVFGAIIVRRQWVDNERLAFPLASVYVSLIEDPEKGRLLNPTLRTWPFWVGALGVLLLHTWNGLGQYYPQPFPRINLSFDLTGVLTEQPWTWIAPPIKSATLYFSLVGIAFFLQSKVGFSLWATFLLGNAVANMGVKSVGADITYGMKVDQSLGAAVVFGLTVLWIGRRHWALVGRQMVFGPRRGEPRGRYLPYAFAGWGFVVCCLGAMLWLMAAGVTPLGAVVIVMLVLLIFLVMARVVAETGLIFAQVTTAEITRVWLYRDGIVDGLNLANAEPRVAINDYYHTRLFYSMFTHDARESLAVYATTSLRVADQTAYRQLDAHALTHGYSPWRRASALVLCIALALTVGYAVAATSTLYVHYTFDAKLDRDAASPIEPYGMSNRPREDLVNVRNYLSNAGIRDSHSRLLHFGGGAVVTSLLAYLRLRFEAWPFHPVGFLLLWTYPMGQVWFSLLLGWMAKVLIVKFGGVPMIRSLRPLFLGLIVGEASAAAFWLVVSLVLNAAGIEYRAINLLPT